MVFPRENGHFNFSKFVAVCALVTLQGATAQEITAIAITPKPTTATVCVAASGDVAVGVQAIPDATCKAGGLGCYSETCRFCKYSETSKSAHLLSCSSFGYNFPTLAPEPYTISAGDCGISEGDLAVGILAVSDTTCASGGLGCYSDHCRYCKDKETPQSAHLGSCSLYGVVATPIPVTDTATPNIATGAPVVTSTTGVPVVAGDTIAPVVEGTAAPIVVDTVAPIVVDTVAPVVVDTVAPVVVDTIAPIVVDTAAPVVVDTVAPVVVDTIAPIVVDTAAPVVVDTVAPVVVDTIAPVVVDTAAPVVVDTVAPVVVDTIAPVVVDPSVVVDTAAPVVVDTVTPVVVDTVAPVVVDTIAPIVVDPSAPVVVDTAAPVIVDPAVVVDTTFTESPGTVIPNPEIPTDGTTYAPVDGTASTEEPIFWQADQVATECVADESFVILGIDAVADPTVADSDFDFYSTGCRLCKTIDIPDYDAFLSCAIFPAYTGSDTTTDTNVDTTGSVATETIAPIDAETIAPIDTGTLAPVDDTPIDTAAPACALTVSEGDAAVGIEIISDANCANGGLGCIDSSCRFCKLWTTPQSTHLFSCSDLLSPPTETPVPATECSLAVSVGDAAAGIELITDTDCVNGGLGCYDDVCRYCKVTETTLSAHLEYCSVYTSGSIFGELDVGATQCSIDSSYKILGIDVVIDASVTDASTDYYMDGCRFCKLFDTAESATFTSCSSIPGYGSPPTCTKVVSSGDAGVGINITTDATCSGGGSGCIDSICRFCKVRETYQSAHLVNCSLVGTAAATAAPVATAATGAIPLTCTSTVTSGDAGVGLSMVTDLSCGDGGVGCTSSICRLCRTFNTSQSLTYMNCSDVKYIDTSDITLVPIPVTDSTTTATTATPVATTAAPVTTTAAPVATTAAPVATTAAPVATTAAPVATTAAPVAATAAPITTTAAPTASCTQTVSAGDKAAGLDIVTDVSCLSGGLGCIGASACKFCKTTSTTSPYDYCPGYPQTAVSTLLVTDAGAAVESADAGLMTEMSDFIAKDARTPALVAAAVGCVAVVALVAVGARRAARRLRRAGSGDASASVEEDESVLSSVSEASVATATGVEDAGDV